MKLVALIGTSKLVTVPAANVGLVERSTVKRTSLVDASVQPRMTSLSPTLVPAALRPVGATGAPVAVPPAALGTLLV